jgi:hypothetical protein
MSVRHSVHLSRRAGEVGTHSVPGEGAANMRQTPSPTALTRAALVRFAAQAHYVGEV